MAIQIQKKIKVNNAFQMVKLQLLLHTFFKGIKLSDAELECATHLAMKGFKKSFFKEVVDERVFTSEQAVRNCMSKLRARKIAVKEGKEWKINPEITLGVDHIILLDLKVGNVK
jgi:phosphorylcholine metabolism protein LicD